MRDPLTLIHGAAAGGEMQSESAHKVRGAESSFAEWFSGSKVVDAEGKPLVVYHGTSADFDDFALQEGGQSKAIFFAGPTATRYVEFYVAQLGDGQRTIPAYLSLQDPKTVLLSWDDETFADPVQENAHIEAAKREGHDGVIFKERDSGEVFYAVFRPEQVKSAIVDRPDAEASGEQHGDGRPRMRG